MNSLEQVLNWEYSHQLVENAKCLTGPGRELGHWAIDQLKVFMGERWFDDIGGKGHILLSLQWWNINDSPGVYGNLFVLAAQLLLLRNFQDFNKLKYQMRKNHDNSEWLHSLLQLEIAGNALRYDWKCRFEPDLRDGKSTDLFIFNDERNCFFEIVTMRSSNEFQETNKNFKIVNNSLQSICMTNGVSISGEMDRMLSEKDIDTLIYEFEKAAIEVATTNADVIIEERGSYKIKITSQPNGDSFSGPPTSTDILGRIGARIKDKAKQTGSEKNVWIYFGDYSGLWEFTLWGQLSLTDKLRFIGIQIRGILHDYPNISGLIISNGWSLGAWASEDTVEERDDDSNIISLAIRRISQNIRSKETIIIGRDGTVSDDLMFLAQWFYEETSWLDWAFQKIGFNYRTNELFNI
ncbi:MAG TPA: hypothetical protein VN426_04050 [Syntrophomonadaceae bacterium]|nr:hypothetical protein [Syntrophomonadaceae bacterium]